VALVIVINLLPQDAMGAEKGNTVSVMSKDLSEAELIEIKNQNGQYKLQKGSNGYYVVGKEKITVQQSNVTALLSGFGSLTSTRTVVEKPSEKDLAAYGLDDPAILTVQKGMERFILKIGIATTTGSGSYYAQVGDQAAVYLIDSTLPDVVLANRFQFYSPAMATYSENTSDQQTLKWFRISGKKAAAEFEIKMNELGEDEVGSAYVLTKPVNHSMAIVMQEMLYEMLPALTSPSVVGDDLSEASLKRYGLLEPAYTLTFIQNDKIQTVHFGDVNETTGMQYCYLEGGLLIHQIDTTYTEFMGYSVKEFCEDMIYTRAYDTLNSIKVSGGGKNYNITLGEADENGDFAVAVNNKIVDSELFGDFYSHILMIGVTGMGDKGNSDTPLVTLEFNLKDGGTEVVKFFSVSEMNCFCEIDGKGKFYVTSYNVEKILENAQKLYDGQAILIEW
jgi:hypothetical protein